MHYNRLSSFNISDIDKLLKSHPAFRALSIDFAEQNLTNRLEIYNKVQEDIQALYQTKEVIVPITIDSDGQVTFDTARTSFYKISNEVSEKIRKSILGYNIVDNSLKNLYENFFTAEERLMIYNIASQLLGNLYNSIESEEYQFIPERDDSPRIESFYNLLLDEYFIYDLKFVKASDYNLTLDEYLTWAIQGKIDTDKSLLLDEYFTYEFKIAKTDNNLLLDEYFTYFKTNNNEVEYNLLLDEYFEHVVA